MSGEQRLLHEHGRWLDLASFERAADALLEQSSAEAALPVAESEAAAGTSSDAEQAVDERFQRQPLNLARYNARIAKALGAAKRRMLLRYRVKLLKRLSEVAGDSFWARVPASVSNEQLAAAVCSAHDRGADAAAALKPAQKIQLEKFRTYVEALLLGADFAEETRTRFLNAELLNAFCACYRRKHSDCGGLRAFAALLKHRGCKLRLEQG